MLRVIIFFLIFAQFYPHLKTNNPKKDRFAHLEARRAE